MNGQWSRSILPLGAITGLSVILYVCVARAQTSEPTPPIYNFYSAQHPEWPPLPCPPVEGLTIYYLSNNAALMDDEKVDYVQVQQEAELLSVLEFELGMSAMMSSSFAGSFAYGNPVYLTNMAAVLSSNSLTASFDIRGGTNFVPYDILVSTNIAAPISEWNWLGIGYTSNRYMFFNQPFEQSYYLLAKPSKTMVVGWGANDIGQCDVPFGITNTVMVTAGAGHTLLLRSNGTAMAWGFNNYGQGSVPTNLAGITMVAAGWYHNVALLTNGTVTAWGLNYPPIAYTMTDVPLDLTNAIVIAAQALHSVALRSNGTVVAWGYNPAGETNVPAGLSNVVAIAAGYQHCLAAKADGTVVAWGLNTDGQCAVPANLSNIVDVAGGVRHSLALRGDGTVTAWGGNTYGETNVPTALSNVVAIAVSGDPFNNSSYSVALKSDNTIVTWGGGGAVTPLAGMSNVVAIAGGADHALALRSGPGTPVMTLMPTDRYQVPGGNVNFTSRGAGLYAVGYQWKSNGVNIAGATNVTLALTNIQPTHEADYAITVSNEVGTITSPGAHLYVIGPPVITSMSLPTNPVCIYGNILSFNVTATSVGQLNGFPLSYQWKFNGTNITGATTTAYSFTANDDSSGMYSVKVANAAGSTNVSWQVTVTNAINVTKDLLLIYNTTSTNSIVVKDYYLTHRPMVSGANVLGIACTTNDMIGLDDFTNQITPQVGAWLTNNPTKRPQYIILFPDLPRRVWQTADCTNYCILMSVSYGLHTNFSDFAPFVTCINMGLTNPTNDCIAYINKLAAFGTNGQLVISADTSGYGNTNFVLDNIRHGYGYTVGPFSNGYAGSGGVVSSVTNALITAGVTASSIQFFDGLENITNGVPYNLPHPTGQTNLAGYMCWGAHSSLGNEYAQHADVLSWGGNSAWWIIETIESFNGWRYTGQGTFIQWFSENAFGGTNYQNTPVGAVSHTDEPLLPGINDPGKYFSFWASGKWFGIAAWDSRRTPFFQAVGDPFVKK